MDQEIPGVLPDRSNLGEPIGIACPVKDCLEIFSGPTQSIAKGLLTKHLKANHPRRIKRMKEPRFVIEEYQEDLN